MKNIAIFASGTGTNAENIIKYFSTKNSARVILVLSNKSHAPVLERAAKFNIETGFFDRHQFYDTEEVVNLLLKKKTDLIVLAGFLWLVPDNILTLFRGRILNIHPALLPSYGGKGMYGDRVHKAVIAAGEEESGITVHYVNEVYDSGDIIFQARCKVYPDDDIHSLAERVHSLEYEHYPAVIERFVGEM